MPKKWRIFKVSQISFLFTFLCLIIDLKAHESLPGIVQMQSPMPLMEVGQGTYRKFGFHIYDAVLWAPLGMWDPSKPFALELKYLRSLSKETITDSILDDIRNQNVTDEVTFAHWSDVIKNVMPEVKDGDIMIGLSIPNEGVSIYFNGVLLIKTDDEVLSHAFFNIWLGDEADEDLRSMILKSAN